MSSESTSLPLPLPADVDLSGMDFMPVFDSRLTKSKAWLRAKNWRGGGPGLGFCLFNLWIAAFRAVPAGSLEDDDDVLADAANCDIAYWTEIKDKALTGWQLAEGRWHHPVVSQISWGLWRQRLEKRHENALNSWRMVAKRAADKGLEPPDPPGSFAAWVADKYPASSAYIYVLAEQADARVAAAAERENGRLAVLPEPDEPSVELCGARALNIGPKVSKGKESPPIAPPLPVAANGKGEERPKAASARANGKQWWAAENTRLRQEFGKLVPLLLSHLQRPGVSGEHAFVQVFRGAQFDPRGPCIVMPTKRRADALWADHSEWIVQNWPQLRVRHATVDELRAFKARGVA